MIEERHSTNRKKKPNTARVRVESNHEGAGISSLYKASERIELAFWNLQYSVYVKEKFRKAGEPKEKKILQNITGRFRPGRLTAIMGSSGAGKTTLLSVLAGNTRQGQVDGEIYVNGELFTPMMLKEISGFVFQDDVLLETMTVKEAILQSALLRLPKSVTAEEREYRVNEIIEVLHLGQASNTIVGSPLKKGISGGERKRTAIGMEMVVNPAVLFLDEPTTGLDTFTAYTVIMSLKRLTRQGRTVVATIHQPSTETFKLFDDLVIMSRGRIAYFGPVRKVISYFARNGYQCPLYMNPADYIFMDVLREFGTIVDDEENDDSQTTSVRISSVTTSSKVLGSRSEEETLRRDGLNDTLSSSNSAHNDQNNGSCQNETDKRIEALLQDWEESEERKDLIQKIKNREKEGVERSALRHKAPFYTQFSYLFMRALKNFVRNRALIFTRLFQAIFIGLVVGLVYVKTNDYSMNVQIRNKSGALYFIAVNLFFAASSQVLAIFGTEKPVFYREFNGGYYSIGPYYLSKTLVEVPGQIIGPYLMVIICYYMIGLTPAFSDYLFIATLGVLGALCGNAYGTLIAALIDDLPIALAVAPLFILPFIVVSGIFVAALPVYINWLKYISPIYYSFSGMLQTQFSAPALNCNSNVEPCTEDQIFSELSFEATFSPGVDVVFLVTIFFTLWIAGFFALYIGAKRKK